MDSTDRESWEHALGLLRRARRWFVLTGAGCSTESGIPDYRDAAGRWKRPPPVHWQLFREHAAVRRRYWSRSLAGWAHFAEATPNPGHAALASLEAAGRVHQLVTQNVDGLHQRAGSRRVIDLHGRIDRVRCVDCGLRLPRAAFQEQLRASNPDYRLASTRAAPDGDADVAEAATDFVVPDCPECAGMLRPEVVFFGEAVPKARVERALARLRECDAVLVAGSSLMLFSGYRFARAASAAQQPILLCNLGRTRADDLAAVRLTGRCGQLLPRLCDELLGAPAI
jgi:NAD-dependent SIR2 family protein deacetylase